MRFNKNYQLKGENCLKNAKESALSPNKKEIEIFDLIRDEAISEKLVFFGGYACSLFSEHLKKAERPVLYSSMPSFDLLSEHAEKSASKIKKVLDKTGDFKSVIIEKREEFGEHVSSHYELIVDGRTVAFIYEPSPGACHNYNVVKINGKDVHIATTDTILSFYLLFLYIDRPYYDRDRLLCMSQYIYDLQYDKLTKNEGIFKRFSKPCIGKQVTLKDIKDAKAHMFEKLKNKRRDVLNTAGMRGYRRGTFLLPESYWWTRDEKKIGLAVDYIGTMLIEDNVEEEGYYNDGLLIRCIKE
jgi:hypothetical protein